MLLTSSTVEPDIRPALHPLWSKAFASLAKGFVTYRNHGPALQQHSDTELVALRDYAGSCAELPFPLHATHEAGQRRMMQTDNQHALSGSTTTRLFSFTFPQQQSKTAFLDFQKQPLPSMGLHFLPRSPPRRLKRGRAAADIDGEHSCMQKKKRRLRLFLITSRLSPQFSHPATNIVDRGSSKIAVWAKQKSMGRNLLRKAAIFNRIRRQAVSAKQPTEGHDRVPVERERAQHELKLAKLEFDHGSVDTYTRPVTIRTPSVPPTAAVRSGGRFIVSGSPSASPDSSRSSSPTPPSPPLHGQRDVEASEYRSPNEAYASSPPRAQTHRREYLPLPPSPLGLSNYDAFDIEEDIPNPYSHLDEDEEGSFFTSFHNDDDDDEDSVPFSPSAVTTTSSTTLQTTASNVLNTPPQANYADFSNLDHNEPVFGDYDQVDDGADAVWPSTLAQEVNKPTIGSTPPDLQALFATAASKRIDSFAASSSTRPSFSDYGSPKSTSPNIVPTALPTAMSPNFVATTSPNLAPSTSPNFASFSASPNFSAIDAPWPHSSLSMQRRHSLPAQPQSDFLAQREENDIEQERRRQRDLMFMRFSL